MLVGHVWSGVRRREIIFGRLSANGDVLGGATSAEGRGEAAWQPKAASAQKEGVVLKRLFAERPRKRRDRKPNMNLMCWVWH